MPAAISTTMIAATTKSTTLQNGGHEISGIARERGGEVIKTIGAPDWPIDVPESQDVG